MTETNPSQPSPPPTVCACGGCPVGKGRRGPVSRANMKEWRDPDVLGMIRAAGQRVRFIREQLDMRRPEFAELCKLSVKTLADIELGRPKEQAYLMVAAREIKIHYYRFFWPEDKWVKFVDANLEKFTARRDALAKVRAETETDDTLP